MQNKRLLPVGIQSFEEIRNRGYIYVDKTDLIYKAATTGKPYFLSRPRRFGKSLLLSTMEAYFTGKKELFDGLKISEEEKDWIEYPVIKISFAGDKFTDSIKLKEKIDYFLSEYENKWNVEKHNGFSNRFSAIIKNRYEKTKRHVVVLIDEYDKPILDALYTEYEKSNQDILQGFYSPLKEMDDYLQFVFITGITKISHVNIFSGLNNLNDISTDKKYESICGITEKELKDNFMPEIEELSQSQELSVEQTLLKLKNMYDGYHFTKNLSSGMYNPFSLLKAFSQNDFGYYWFESGTPSMLISTLQNKPADLLCYAEDFMTGETNFKDYEPENGNLLPVIYQSGYLTIKNYDKESELYTLGLPNREVEKGLYNIIIPKFTTIPSDSLGLTIERLRQSFRKEDVESILMMLKTSILDIPTLLQKNQCENYYEAITHVIFRQTGFEVTSELQSLEGRSDITVSTGNAVFIFELKMDKGNEVEKVCDTALKQIEEKRYAERYALSGKVIHKIALVFSSDAKGVSGWKWV